MLKNQRDEFIKKNEKKKKKIDFYIKNSLKKNYTKRFLKTKS